MWWLKKMYCKLRFRGGDILAYRAAAPGKKIE